MSIPPMQGLADPPGFGGMIAAAERDGLPTHLFQRVSMVTRVGPLATINCEPSQTRKGAAAAVDSCAGVWLAGVASIISYD